MIKMGLFYLILLITTISDCKVTYVGDKLVERKHQVSVAEVTSGNSLQDPRNDRTSSDPDISGFDQQKNENQTWKNPRMIAIFSGLTLLFFCYASLHIYKCLLLYF